MNPWYNPVFLTKILYSYLFDVNRIFKSTDKNIKKYQDKCFRKIVKYAYTVPVYYKKFKKLNIHPRDINGVLDIKKLPIISKEDIMENYPKGIIPKNFDQKNSYKLSTSGSTGNPVFIYSDIFSLIKSLLIFSREINVYGGNWRKTKIALIIDLEPGSIESSIFTQSAVPFLKKLMPLENIKYIHIGEKPELIIDKLNTFQPEFLGSDPGMLRNLAHLKNNGKGNEIKPTYIITSGSILDSYTKNFIENSFNSRVLDTYATTETGTIAFECLKGNHYHIHNDFIFLEILDDNNKPTSKNKPGNVVITKLYGNGTPFIRYSGLNDIITPIDINCYLNISKKCIKHIEGRSTDMIILPDNTLLSPLTLTGIPAKIMKDFNSYKIKQFQIVQHTKKDLEIKIVIDEKKRNQEISVERIKNELKARFQKQVGKNISIRINDVENIGNGKRPDETKVVLSKIHNK
jgi:phenylacetate-CoA ligase